MTKEIAELDRLLAGSLADRTLQTGEKRALLDWAASHLREEPQRALARSRAFHLVRQAMPDAQHPILDWLEDVIKTLSRAAPESSPTEKSRAYFSPGTSCIQEIVRQFQVARSNCDVCVFTITDDRIRDAILQAHRRGVRVRIISDAEKSLDAGSDIDQFMAAGIPCRIDIGEPAHMHHKFALFDGRWLLTGSFNWTRSASEVNEENLIATADPDLIAAFSARFEQLWNRLED